MVKFNKCSGGKKNKQPSFLKVFAATQLEHMRKRNPAVNHTIKDLLASIMMFITDFASPRPNEKNSVCFEVPLAKLYDNYSNDAVFCELGCYALYHIDSWLINHMPKERSDILTDLVLEYFKLFETVLNSSQASLFFIDRFKGYMQLKQNNAEPENYHFHLTQLLLRCRDNKPYGKYFLDDYPIILADACEISFLNMELLAWEKESLPVIMDMVKTYFEKYDDDQTSSY